MRLPIFACAAGAALLIAACAESGPEMMAPTTEVAVGLAKIELTPNICHHNEQKDIGRTKNVSEWQPLTVKGDLKGHLKHGDFVITEATPCPPQPHLSVTGSGSYALPDFCAYSADPACEDTHTFTVTNDGNAATGQLAMTLANYSNGGMGSLQIVTDNCASISLAPGASCTVEVRFSSETDFPDCPSPTTANLRASDGTVSGQIGLLGWIAGVGCVECTVNSETGICDASLDRPRVSFPWLREKLARIA